MRAPARTRRNRSSLIALAATIALFAALPLAPTPAGAAAPPNGLTSWKLKSVFADVSLNHAVYVPQRDTLLVVLGPRDPSLGNELVEVNPATGRIGRHARFGSNPTRIALTSDGLFAYLAFAGTSAIAKVDLTTFLAVQYIRLANDPEGGATFAIDLAVSPGNNDLIVAAVHHLSCCAPTDRTLVAFRNGVALPRTAASEGGRDVVVFRNAAEVLAFSGTSVSRLSVTSDGLHGISSYRDDRFGAHGKMAGKYLAQASGALSDPATGTIVRTFGNYSYGYGVAPSVANDRIAFAYYGSGGITDLSLYVLSTGALVDIHHFYAPVVLRDPRDIVATSAGYAIVASTGLHLFGPGVQPDASSNVPAQPKALSAKWQQTRVPWAATDLVWDPVRRLLYAAIRSTDETYPNEIIAIQPETQRVVKRVFVGGNPIAMDMTDLGTSLFVSLSETNAVAKVDLLTFLVVQQIPLGTIDEKVLRGGDIDALPLTTDSFAIVVREATEPPVPEQPRRGVAMYTLGLRSPSAVFEPGNHIATIHSTAVSPLALYGSGNGKFSQMRVSATGVETVDTNNYWLTYSGEFTFAKNGTAWGSDGSVFAPAGPFNLGWNVMAGPIVLDEARNRAYEQFFGDVFEIEMSTGKVLNTVFLNGYIDQVMVQFGNGIAGISGGITFVGPRTCLGREATVSGLTGTSGNDVIIGTDYADDTIVGGGGNDIICGLGGNDWIWGGDGQDYVDGGQGNDSIAGGSGNDGIGGGEGDDRLSGGSGIDTCQGNNGTNAFTACELTDQLLVDTPPIT